MFWQRILIFDKLNVVKEALHTIKSKHLCAFIIKLDLIKAFDRVNWTFIRLLLIQIGAPLQLVNWIMGCVSSATFAVLINGSPSSFFPASRGI